MIIVKLRLVFYLLIFGLHLFWASLLWWGQKITNSQSSLIAASLILLVVVLPSLNQRLTSTNSELEALSPQTKNGQEDVFIGQLRALIEAMGEEEVSLLTTVKNEESVEKTMIDYQLWMESEPSGWQVLINAAIVAHHQNRVEEAKELLNRAERHWLISNQLD